MKTPDIKALLVENIHASAKQALETEKFSVNTTTHSPTMTELSQMLLGHHLLGIRSKTELRQEFFKSNQHLLAIGAFCIGTNQIDLDLAARAGIPVFNAPYSNTRSVAELVISELIALSRQLMDRSQGAHKGQWVKSADGSNEVRGKTLGIVGYGHIGSQVSILAEALGLSVLFYDTVKKLPLGNAHSVATLEELLQKSDFVTLHVPETPQTKDMISEKNLKQMKKGSYLLNLSRGTVVVIEDLAKALKEKHIAGAAIDVFPVEPASNKEKFVSPLQSLPNVILTPHIGGSTEEAQFSIGQEVADSFKKFIKFGTTAGAVNFPQVEMPLHSGALRILNVHRNEPGVLGEINGIVSKHGGNILGQSLSTQEDIGYLVMDIAKASGEPIAKEINQLSRNIRTRVVAGN